MQDPAKCTVVPITKTNPKPNEARVILPNMVQLQNFLGLPPHYLFWALELVVERNGTHMMVCINVLMTYKYIHTLRINLTFIYVLTGNATTSH